MKSALWSRTIWVNALTVIAAGITGVMGTEFIENNPGWTSVGVMALGLINVFLRFITTMPITVDPDKVTVK